MYEVDPKAFSKPENFKSPKLKALNPKPQSLNPKPQSLTPKNLKAQQKETLRA